MTDYNELDYLGMTDGIYYFRDKGSQGGPAYKGDESDYLEWVWAQSTGVKTALTYARGGNAAMNTDTRENVGKTCIECGRPLRVDNRDRVDKGMCYQCWSACHD